MKKKIILFPKSERVLKTLGEHMYLARLRRKISAEMMAQRAGISRTTLWSAEKGSPSVSIGTYVQILTVLGLEQDLASTAADDVLGRKLQDAELPTRKRAPKRRNQA